MGVPKERINAIRTRYEPASATEQPKEALAKFRASEPRFRAELKNALRDSKWVLTLGAEAFRAVSGRRKFWPYIGAPLDLDLDLESTTCLPTWSPGFTKTKGGVSYARLFETHVRRFAYLASGRLERWRWPPLYVDNDFDAESALARIASSTEPVGVDIETDGITLDADLTCIGFATRTDAVSVSIPAATERLEGLARQVLAQPLRKKVWQNGSFDRYTLRYKGYEVSGLDEDTLLQHSILEPHHKHTLGFIASSYFHVEAWKAEHESDSELNKTSKFGRSRDTRVYNVKDALMQCLLENHMGALL